MSVDDQKMTFDRLCAWIEDHLDESIGWHELMRESGLEFQVIHQLFFKYTASSPMTWIRRRREMRVLPAAQSSPQPLSAGKQT